jgi:hypothetical protein
MENKMDSDELTGTLEDRLQVHILRLVNERDVGKTICPSDAARAERGEEWRTLMKPIRAVAINLAKSGQITIYRKGKPVDPESFKGVIRLGLPQ